MKKLSVLAVFLLSNLVYAGPVTFSGTKAELMVQLLREYDSCIDAGQPGPGQPGYADGEYSFIVVCRKDNEEQHIETMTYQESAYDKNGLTVGYRLINRPLPF